MTCIKCQSYYDDIVSAALLWQGHWADKGPGPELSQKQGYLYDRCRRYKDHVKGVHHAD